MNLLDTSAPFSPNSADIIDKAELDADAAHAELAHAFYDVLPNNRFLVHLHNVDILLMQSYLKPTNLRILHIVTVDKNLRLTEDADLRAAIAVSQKSYDAHSDRTVAWLAGKSAIITGNSALYSSADNQTSLDTASIAIIPGNPHNPDNALTDLGDTDAHNATTHNDPYRDMTLSDMLEQGLTLTPLTYPMCSVSDPHHGTTHIINVRHYKPA